MKLSFTHPDAAAIRAFLARETGDFSYPEVGATQEGVNVPRYDNDHNRVKLGDGEAVFQHAREALLHWEHFPAPWVFIEPHAPIETGQTVAMCAKAFGLWWISAARIVYVIDEPRRFGFAYGTLSAHVECGEERFLVEKLPDGSVWYDLYAFSRPRRWFIKLGYPFARRLQKKFVRDSQQAMLQR
ncbi:MAG: DUF1990 domain-containing protein [Armatimonas sp.]